MIAFIINTSTVAPVGRNRQANAEENRTDHVKLTFFPRKSEITYIVTVHRPYECNDFPKTNREKKVYSWSTSRLSNQNRKNWEVEVS